MVRHKNRYILLEVLPENEATFDSQDLKQNSLFLAIQNKIQMLHGDFGIAATRSGFVSKYHNKDTRIALIGTRHGPHMLVASSIPFITSIENHKVTLKTLYTGATIKQCLKFLLSRQLQSVQPVQANANSEVMESLKKWMADFERV